MKKQYGLGLGLAFWSSVALGVPDDFEFDLEGYYRVRGYSMHSLLEDQEDPGKYMLQRLRLQPEINFQNRAKFFMQMDLLDGLNILQKH